MSNEQNVSGGDEVEAVARAIADCNWRSDAGEDWCAERFNDPDMRPLYLKQARAAISTIRQRSGGVDLCGEVDVTEAVAHWLAWNKYGIAWAHCERASHADLRTEAANVLDAALQSQAAKLKGTQ